MCASDYSNRHPSAPRSKQYRRFRFISHDGSIHTYLLNIAQFYEDGNVDLVKIIDYLKDRGLETQDHMYKVPLLNVDFANVGQILVSYDLFVDQEIDFYVHHPGCVNEYEDCSDPCQEEEEAPVAALSLLLDPPDSQSSDTNSDSDLEAQALNSPSKRSSVYFNQHAQSSLIGSIHNKLSNSIVPRNHHHHYHYHHHLLLDQTLPLTDLTIRPLSLFEAVKKFQHHTKTNHFKSMDCQQSIALPQADERQDKQALQLSMNIQLPSTNELGGKQIGSQDGLIGDECQLARKGLRNQTMPLGRNLLNQKVQQNLNGQSQRHLAQVPLTRIYSPTISAHSVSNDPTMNLLEALTNQTNNRVDQLSFGGHNNSFANKHNNCEPSKLTHPKNIEGQIFLAASPSSSAPVRHPPPYIPKPSKPSSIIVQSNPFVSSLPIDCRIRVSTINKNTNSNVVPYLLAGQPTIVNQNQSHQMVGYCGSIFERQSNGKLMEINRTYNPNIISNNYQYQSYNIPHQLTNQTPQSFQPIQTQCGRGKRYQPSNDYSDQSVQQQWQPNHKRNNKQLNNLKGKFKAQLQGGKKSWITQKRKIEQSQDSSEMQQQPIIKGKTEHKKHIAIKSIQVQQGKHPQSNRQVKKINISHKLPNFDAESEPQVSKIHVQPYHRLKQPQRHLHQVIEAVKRWRYLRQQHSISLTVGAKLLGISKKSLDDYYLVLRTAQQLGYDFRANMACKMGQVRIFIRQKGGGVGGRLVKEAKCCGLVEQVDEWWNGLLKRGLVKAAAKGWQVCLGTTDHVDPYDDLGGHQPPKKKHMSSFSSARGPTNGNESGKSVTCSGESGLSGKD